jgi:hypothetical protein
MSPTSRTLRGLLVPSGAAIVLASLAACSRGRDDADAREDARVVAQVRPASAAPDSLRAGDVRIVTPDSGIDLALLGDTVSTGLSPHALAKVRAETDTSRVTGTGLAASFEKMVKGRVAGAIGTRVAFPLSAVRDVRYEAGAIRFDWVGKPATVFDNAKVNGRPLLESFRPEDARRFVDAARARKRGG